VISWGRPDPREKKYVRSFSGEGATLGRIDEKQKPGQEVRDEGGKLSVICNAKLRYCEGANDGADGVVRIFT